MNENACVQFTYIYILKHPSHAFHLFFHAFSPHLRGVNDLCRFLHELLHALDGRTLFSKRKGCWHQGQHEMSRLQVISFISQKIPSRSISSSIVSCYFHHVSSFWCHLMLLRTPLRTSFYVSSCVVSVRHWFVGCLNVAVPLPAADGLPVQGCLPKSFKESLVLPSPHQFWRQFNTSGGRSSWYHVKSMLFNKYLFVTYDIITFHKLFTFHIQVYLVCVQIYFQKYQIRMVSSCRQGDLALLQLLWNATLNLATPWFSQLTTGRWTPVSWINSVPPGACVMVFCISSFTTSRKSPMAWQGPKSGHPLLFSPGFVEKHGLFR